MKRKRPKKEANMPQLRRKTSLIDVVNTRLSEPPPPTSEGGENLDLAEHFLHNFPIGSEITVESFDTFLMMNGQLEKAERGTPAWADVLSKRNTTRARINAVGRTFVPAFQVEVGKHGQTYIVRDLRSSIESHSNRLPKAVESLIGTKKRQLSNLLRSADLTLLAPFHRVQVEMLAVDIEDFAERVAFDCTKLEQRFQNVREHVTKAAASSPGLTVDGGLEAFKQLSAPAPLESPAKEESAAKD